jgi:hypothetical protein
VLVSRLALSRDMKLGRQLESIIWKWRWLLIISTTLLMFFLVNGCLLSTSQDAGFSDSKIRYGFSFAFAAMNAQLVASIICILHSFMGGRVKWLIGLYVIPLIAFVCLFMNHVNTGAQSKKANPHRSSGS